MPDSEFVSCITDAKKVSAEMAHFVARPAQWRSIHCLLPYSDSAFSTCVPGSVSAHRASPSSQLFLQPHPPPSVQSPITGPIKTSCLLKILHPFSPSPVSTSWSSYRPNRITYLPPSRPTRQTKERRREIRRRRCRASSTCIFRSSTVINVNHSSAELMLTQDA